MEARGSVALRVIPTAPATTAVYRLDLVMSSIARKTLWLTDAYFVGIHAYVQALCRRRATAWTSAPAVPGGSDVPLVSPLSRSGYTAAARGGRPSLRVEWHHAARQDGGGRRPVGRVGSTNLNLQSWMGNYELDVAVEDAGFAQQMEAIYIEDLCNATEIVLSRRSKVRSYHASRRGAGRRRHRMRGGTSGRAATSAVRWANSVGAALTSRRELGPPRRAT
jgi:cardiolipin synthase